MPKTAMSLDFSEAFKGLDLSSKLAQEGAVTGVGRALLQLKTDMIMQKPTAPIKEGFLRGSTSIFVQGAELPVPLGPRERPDKRISGFTQTIPPGKIVGLIGVNVPYAARWHEVPAHFSEPSAGNKYLESKMANNKMLYRKIVVNGINERLQGGGK